MKKAFCLLGLLFVMGGLFGCSAASPGNSGQAATGTAEQSTDASASKTHVDKIKESGQLTMAMSGKYPPFNFVNKNNELDGFDVDIAKEIAKRMGVEAKPVTTEWDAIIAGLLTNKYDMILGSMAITEERQKKVDFVQYYTSGANVVVPNDSAITGKDDLKGVVVGVALGTTYEKKAREFGAEVKTYSSSVDTFTDMSNNRVKAVIADKLIAANAIKEKGFPFKLVGEPLYDEKCGIAVSKDDTALKDELEKILEAMRQDGTYTKISEKWFGIDIR